MASAGVGLIFFLPRRFVILSTSGFQLLNCCYSLAKRRCPTTARTILQEVLKKLGVYLVGFDRPGYGQSDPHPDRTIKSTAQDVEELADALELGEKFYLISTSMGGVTAWACLKYIQHRFGEHDLQPYFTLVAPQGLRMLNP